MKKEWRLYENGVSIEKFESLENAVEMYHRHVKQAIQLKKEILEAGQPEANFKIKLVEISFTTLSRKDI